MYWVKPCVVLVIMIYVRRLFDEMNSDAMHAAVAGEGVVDFAGQGPGQTPRQGLGLGARSHKTFVSASACEKGGE